MKKYFLALTFLIIFSKYTISQHSFCGTYSNNPQQAKLNARLLQQEEKLNQFVYEFMQQNVGLAINGSTLEVPIVFHVIHQNGPENIADSVIITEVMRLNQRFSNTGMFTYADGVNVNIQFCLASIDPYGNPTTGITRTVSPLTDIPLGGDAIMKNLSRWNPYRYLNVWLVNNSVLGMGYSAYSTMPWDAFGLNDGIVIQASSFGSAYPYFLLSHEVGHFFGLYHNDEGNSCLNDNCLLDNDHVCDTPPEFQPAYCDSNTCSTDMNDTSGFNPFTVDMNDISNIMMPIVGCPYLFTQGQADRMNFFLNTTRNKLLSSNGCGQHPSSNSLPSAQIGNITNTCNGYIFVSNSNNAEYIEWDFNGDGYTDAIGDTVNYLFPTQGYYSIVLRAFNEVGYDADTLLFHSLAQNNTIFPLSSYSGVSNNGGIACMGANLILTAVPGMAHYIWSTGDTTQTIVIPVTGPISVTLTCIDSSGMVWQKCPDPFYYWDVAPSPAPFSLTMLTDDSLCTNQAFQAHIPIQPGTVAQVFSDGYPGILGGDTVVLNFYQQYTNYIVVKLFNLSNYCTTQANDTLHIVFTEPVNAIQNPVVNGNYISVGDTVAQVQWYLDGVPIPWANNDTLFMDAVGCYNYEAWNDDRDCSVMSGSYCQVVTANERSIINKRIIYPNPHHDMFFIQDDFGKLWNAKIHITDVLGRAIPYTINYLNVKTAQITLAQDVSGTLMLHIGNEVQLILKN